MQTSYSLDQSSGLPGLLADAGPVDVVSKINAVAAVPFGKLVIEGASDDLCVLPSVTGDITTKEKVLGVAVKSHAMESSLSGVPQYPVKSVVSVLRKGRIWTVADENVTPSDPVFVRYAAGGQGVGSFGKSAGTSERSALDGAKYVSTALAGELVMVEVNFVA